MTLRILVTLFGVALTIAGWLLCSEVGAPLTAEMLRNGTSVVQVLIVKLIFITILLSGFFFATLTIDD